RNDNGRFQHKTPIFAGVWFGDVTSGDLDGDGRVEILLNGRYQAGVARHNRFLIYRNEAAVERELPPVPIALASRRDGDQVILSWRLPWAYYLENRSYSYNLRIGTTP